MALRSTFGRALVASGLALAVVAGAASAAVEGDLDKSFSGDGKLITRYNAANFATALDAATDFDGKLVVAGADSGEIGVARFNPDGTLDDSFGGDGTVVIDSGPTAGGETARAIAVDPATGNIFVIGDALLSGGNFDLVVARLEPDGDLDPTFDGPGTAGNGVFRLAFDPADNAVDVLANEDKVVLLGIVGSGTTAQSRVIQLESNGAFDTDEFGAPNGYFDFQFQAGAGSFGFALAQQDDGRLLVSGSINGTATYGVARLTTAGALDPTFNSAGTIPGIARPPLPTGFIGARAIDVKVDSGSGIVVSGEIQSGAAPFGVDPMVSRLTSAGLLDTTFGNTSGWGILPLGANPTDLSSFSSLEIYGTDLIAAGTVGPVNDRDQAVARFTSAGALDTTFNPPTGSLITDPGLPSSAVAAPLGSGVTYLAGQGLNPGASEISISAVCIDVSSGCLPPSVPTALAVSPASGSDDNAPKVIGVVPAGPQVTSVEIFTTAGCTGVPAAVGSEAAFVTAGIAVPVPDNTSTTFRATASGVNGRSACSPGVTYNEVTPPPGGGVIEPPSTPPKKCKKGQKLKKGKCVKKKKKKKK